METEKNSEDRYGRRIFRRDRDKCRRTDRKIVRKGRDKFRKVSKEGRLIGNQRNAE